jgi:uncharacterized phage-associated protein
VETSTTISAFDVAHYFLAKANSEGDLITHLKMQKLLYYAQAWYLVNHDKPLFKEQICPWNLGPVIPEIYHAFKKFSASPIIYEATGNEESLFTEDEKNYLDEFYSFFIKFAAHELVNMSHNEPPWKKAFQNKDDGISIDVMKQFYSSMLKDDQEVKQK